MVNEPAPETAPPAPSAPQASLPPGYVWAYQTAARQPPPWKPPRWLVVATVVWGVALLVAGIVYARDGKPTVRGQTTIVGAVPVVDRAVLAVATAAGTGPAVRLGGFVKVSDCHITPVRSGVDYARTITLYTAPGSESALLHAIATGLPRSYAAASGPGAILDLHADAGDYVGVVGAAPSPGVIEIRADTGCREAGGRIAAAPVADSPALAPAQAVLAALGVQPTSTSQTQITCATGTGTMRTAEAHVAPGQAPGRLGTALASLAATPVASTANLFAYRSGGTDIVATQDSDGLTVSATTRC